MIYTLEDFKNEMDNISKEGWIKTHRSGPTGIGKTLEDLLGIQENNASEPDFGVYELKASRNNDESMLTLFTKSPQPRRVNGKLLENYGYYSEQYEENNRKKVIHSTLSTTNPVKISDTGKSLSLVCSENRISIVDNENDFEAFWDKSELKKVFDKKFKHTLIYVKADSVNSGTNEKFLYKEAFELSGFNYNGLIELLEKGIVKIDIRIGQYSDGRTHDHGTAFRIHPKYFDQLFLKKNLIWARK
ncbi:MvaI/BcnI family restriction endonuclease [Fusobacterium polymorphum]|uniref:MvaI/BcnI family restriction endonuclease n=1 Tax=Fusobacterium nucleatum subsp. polymorphum TaxID=76857 RepID=UPI003008B4D9